jgi:hypothetical protein
MSEVPAPIPQLHEVEDRKYEEVIGPETKVDLPPIPLARALQTMGIIERDFATFSDEELSAELFVKASNKKQLLRHFGEWQK